MGPNEFISPEWSPDGRSVYVSLYRADRNAAELWRYEVGSAIVSNPAVAGNRIILGASDGNIYCFGN